jgi:hypothetical protein
MIGPTSALYDPEQALAQAQESAEYQRWVEAYGSGPMDYTPGDHNAAGLSQFRQQRPPPQEAISGRIPHTTTESVPLQNQYQFVTSGQYGAPVIDHHYISNSGRQASQLAQAGSSARPTGSDYSASVRTHQQHSSGSLHTNVDYNQVPQQTMGSDLYYYPSDLVVPISHIPMGTQVVGAHINNNLITSRPIDQSTFTPSSDLHTLPPHTSVSPPWTEERLPQGYGPGPSSAGPSTAGPSTAQKPRLGLPVGKRERGVDEENLLVESESDQRKSGGGDSESESDEDASEAVQTPSRGPENLPTRL